MGTNLLVRTICVVLCPALALVGYLAISSCECGCVDIAPFTVCCCDAAASGSGTAAVTSGSDDCRVEIGDQKPPADPPPSSSLNPQTTALAAADIEVPHFARTPQSTGGAVRPSQLASISSQSPRAPPPA